MSTTRKLITISIVIPVYNDAVVIIGCLESIKAQSSLPDEVIIVDNNSTDQLLTAVNQFDINCPIRVLAESRQGIAYARTTGFNAARSNIICRIDADTVLPPDWTAYVRQFYDEQTHAHSVLTGGCYFYNLRSGRLTGRTYDFIVHRINRLAVGYYFPWGSNCAIPRPAWLKVADSVSIRRDIHEDLDLGIVLKQAGFTALYRPELRVGVRARRILSDRGALWPYLTMWPRTLRIHGIRSWPLLYPVLWSVWVGSYGVFTIEAAVKRILTWFA